jgi:hypothetical protein
VIRRDLKHKHFPPGNFRVPGQGNLRVQSIQAGKGPFRNTPLAYPTPAVGGCGAGRGQEDQATKTARGRLRVFQDNITL